jgi:hypothetical protein
MARTLIELSLAPTNAQPLPGWAFSWAYPNTLNSSRSRYASGFAASELAAPLLCSMGIVAFGHETNLAFRAAFRWAN